MSIINLEHINFKYRGKIPAIQDITLNIEKNEAIGLIGPNGAGKSTLAKILAGFIRPNSGIMRLKNKNYKKLSIFNISKQVGYLFQNPDVMLCTSSIFDEVSIGLKRQKVSLDKIKKTTANILRFLGLYTIQKFHPRRLSQGEKKRVNLGFILASRPKVIILDEPFAGLDYNRKNELLSYLIKLKDNHILILISHDIESILNLCDRIVILNDGRKIFDDSVSKLKENPEKLVETGLKLPFLFKLFDQFKEFEEIKSIPNYKNLTDFLEEKLKDAK
ncbi:MAG: energy-coupling factor ABC transporter ATP-binding protein [Promethearchaeota archaeon]